MSAPNRLKNLSLLIPLLVAFGMYLPSVTLPFFSDDVIHLRGVTTVSSEYILTHADLGMYYANNYYRPVVNLILRTQHVLGVEPSAPFWHTLMILTHMLNTALVGLLVRQLRLSRFAIFTAMLIFAVYPFSWQVAVWVLAWFHSLVLTAILLSVTAAIRFFRRPHLYGMLILAVLAGSLAPFIHENGLFASVLIFLLVALTQHTSVIRWRALAVLVPIGGAAAVYLYLWTTITGRQLPLIRFLPAAHVFSGSMMVMAVMPQRYLTTTLTFNTWLKKLFIVLLMIGASFVILSLRGQGIWTAYHLKAAYLTQGLSFPLQWVAAYAPLPAEKQVWLGGLIFAALWSVVFTLEDSRTRRVLLVGAGWFGVMCVLPMLYLGEGYVLCSPRLFYAAAPGIALTLAVLLDHLRGFSRLACIGILAGVLILSIGYVREREGLHLKLGQAYQDMFAQMPEDENARILVVNAPRWMASDHNPFPLDRMGAVFVPDYYPLEEFLRVNLGRNYTHLTEVTDADTMYMTDRVTGIGEVLPHAEVMALAQTQDVVYTFHIEE